MARVTCSCTSCSCSHKLPSKLDARNSVLKGPFFPAYRVTATENYTFEEVERQEGGRSRRAARGIFATTNEPRFPVESAPAEENNWIRNQTRWQPEMSSDVTRTSTFRLSSPIGSRAEQLRKWTDRANKFLSRYCVARCTLWWVRWSIRGTSDSARKD